MEDKGFELGWNTLVALSMIFVILGMSWIVIQAIIRFVVTLL